MADPFSPVIHPSSFRPLVPIAARPPEPPPAAASREDYFLDPMQDASPTMHLINLLQAKALRPRPSPRLAPTEAFPAEGNPVCYEDFARILGDGRFASGSFSDVSVSASDKNDTPRPNCSVGSGSSTRDVSSNVSGDPRPRVKFMCSLGGKILPRPSDGILRYVGGETRIISVDRHISYTDLMLKMTECYGQGLAMKYQLPDEDLDALISVFSDEDFENMMEEYDRLESSDGSTRLRVFLFSLDECDVAHFSDSGDPRISEQLYVDAVNGVMETGFQKQLDIVSTSSSHDLMGLEISDPWNTSQMPESVPAALLASPISQDLAVSMVQSVSTGVPGLPQQAFTKTPSALSSAPSNLMQVRAVNKHSLTPGVTSLFLPDQFLEFCGHPYNGLPSDGSYPDLKFGDFANPSAAAQHDVLYRFPESGRFPDSRTQAQREMLSSLQDQVHLGEHRHVLNARVPRVDSHGRMSRVESNDKLMQLQEQHTQFAKEPGSAVSRLDSFMPQADLQQVAVQQQQLQSSQLVWQHQANMRPETHRMVDLAQQVASDSIHAQVQPLQHRQWQGSYLHLPSAALEHETSAYRLMDRSQLQNDVFNEHAPSHKLLALNASEAQHFSGIPSSPTFQVGSAPPSPRVGLRDNTAIQIGGQQHLLVHQVSNGAGCADNRYGRRLDQNNDQISGGLLLTDSSPHYRERVILDEEHIAARQQASTPLVNRECIPQEQLSNYSNIKHEPLQGKCHISDELLRTVVAPYDGVSTFQDRPAFFQGRQDAEESQFLPHEQQNLMNPHKDVRLEFQEQMLQPGQQFSVNPPYRDRQIEGNWIQRNLYQDESREFIGGRSRTDNLELGADPVASSHAETLAVAANLPAMQPLEGSKGFLGLAGRDAGATTPKMDGYDPFDSSPFNITAGLPPSITGNAPTALRTVYVDASKAVHAAEIIEPDILPEQTAKGTGTANVTTFDNEMSVQLTASNAKTNLSSSQTLSDDGATGIASTPLASSMTLSMPTMAIGSTGSLSTGKMADGQWNDDLDLDGVRSEFTGHSSGQAGHRSNENIDCKSALILENELSRPGSGGNRSMVEGAFDVPSKQELHSYKWVDSKSLIDDVTLVPPHILYAAEVNDVLPPASFPLAVASLSTGLDSFTFNKASLPGSSVSVVGPTPVSLVAEARNPSNCLASSAVNLNPFSLPTSISVSFLPEEIEGREEIATADKSDLMVATVLEATAYERSPENASNQVGSHDDGKEDGEHGAENAAAALLQPPLYSFPTLSVQNWEKSLAQAEFEEKAVKENLPGGKSLNDVKLDISTEKEVTLQEVKVDVEEDKDDPKIDKSSNSAAAAEAEAIARDLQVIKNSDLEELQELGSGTFGTVYHGKWRGTDVAIKRIKSSCFTGRLAEQERLIADFWREAYILGRLHHPNVVAFYGVVPDGPGGTLATVTEYMVNGSLKQVLQKKDRTIDRRKRFVLAMDAAFGMEYLHGKKIVHFDLKCDNLLVNMRDPQRPICKVGDLGLSKVKQQTMVSGGVRGTLPWMAPELLNGSTSMVSEKVDVFSFGIVMWELLTGEEPYANMHYGVIIGGILNNTLRPPIPRWCDPAWKFLMERCWSADPLERPSFTQIVAELRTMATSVHGKG